MIAHASYRDREGLLYVVQSARPWRGRVRYRRTAVHDFGRRLLSPESWPAPWPRTWRLALIEDLGDRQGATRAELRLEARRRSAELELTIGRRRRRLTLLYYTEPAPSTLTEAGGIDPEGLFRGALRAFGPFAFAGRIPGS